MTTPSTPARWMTLWLPHLPTDRLRRTASSPSDDRPLALYGKARNIFALTAVDAAARKAGLREGMALADAQAMQPDARILEADADADAALLDSIAAWSERFSPVIVVDAPDGVFLDITGCAHLFGDEAALLHEVVHRLSDQGFAARAAIAPTPGAAWGLARFGKTVIVGPDTLAQTLAPLPIAALRLTADAEALLKRLGLRHIGQIAEAPRAPFTARAGQHAMLRLDQAFGRVPEALSPRRPPPPVFALRRMAEPILTLDAIAIVTDALCVDLCVQLDEAGAGVRLLRLHLFGLDHKTRTIELGLSHAERTPATLLRLLRERLASAAEHFDAEFGFEALRLDATEIAPIIMRPLDLASQSGRDRQAEARLIDVLSTRLGVERIGRLALRETHAPERLTCVAPLHSTQAEAPLPPEDSIPRRPLTLFTHAQPIEVLAETPDGPPMRFRWRRILHEVIRAEGPERIASNWLRAPNARARDYYRVEDKKGQRFWVYRDGQYGEDAPPRWYLHGLFA